MAIGKALEIVNKTGDIPVPLHLRNAPTKLMQELNYGKEYKYAHDYEGHFVNQAYMPEEIQGTKLWEAQPNPAEARLEENMKHLWGEKK